MAYCGHWWRRMQRWTPKVDENVFINFQLNGLDLPDLALIKDVYWYQSCYGKQIRYLPYQMMTA